MVKQVIPLLLICASCTCTKMELSTAPSFGDGDVHKCLDWTYKHPIVTKDDTFVGLLLHQRALYDIECRRADGTLTEESYKELRRRLNRNIRRMRRLR